jgi:CHAT domain-containing protein
MIARHEPLWRDICGVPGARLVMLGTPNGGSHAITELIVARSSILHQLTRIDIQHSPRDLLEILVRFPGVLAMLPKDSREDYFSLETWESYHAGKTGESWVLPEEKHLERAREFRKLLDAAPVDPAHMLYVAGCSDVTIAGMRMGPGGQEIVFEATARGDGRVTWDSGIPRGVPTWYMADVEHGDLPAHEEAFEAIEELLRQGSTHRLSQSPPASRAVEAVFPLPEAADDLFPDEDGLAGAALGAGPRKHMRKTQGERPVQVRVVHGNLAYGSHPVAVGHYAGDAIVSAEKHLDLALESALSRRHQLGLYPGEIGTNAVFINPRLSSNPAAAPKGAIVIGLGTVGSLSAATLTRSGWRAFLEYAVQWKDFGPKKAGGDAEDTRAELGVSALLIGTGAGGITVDDSVLALLQAVSDANKALASARSAQRIGQVEFIEVYEDRAIQAVEALRLLQDRTPLRDMFRFGDELDIRKGSLSRVSYEEPSGWWHRLQVLGGRQEGAPADGSLRFSSSSRRARSEVRLLAPQRALVDEFIQASIRTTRDNGIAARTLFELLLPNEIKDQAPEQEDTVFILDEEAARYPWELLDDRFSRGEGDKPLFVTHGMLRQLESVEFRERIRAVIDNTALVIGDPLSPYPELKGAQAEARAVHRNLQSDGRFRVELRERPSSHQVINALYAGDYKVLHLAGHGVYRLPPKEAANCAACGQPLPKEMAEKRNESIEPLTGMIIGDGVVLSPREVHQMRFVPELVFINCCHLGRIEPGDQRPLEKKNERNDYNRIAANVATEFIRMGVRAVVAAGWAVDDSAALTFATAFYDQMIRGRPFGEAVQKAREEVFERHPQTNTWGAYQCYGDPDYRLIREKDAMANEESFKWVTPSQAVAELNNVAARLATSAAQGAGSEKNRLKAMAAWLKEKKWLVDGRVSAALGRAFGEANLFEKAITYYKRALEAENAQTTLKDIEQLANIESRHAVWLYARGNSKEALAAVNRSIGRLEAIQCRGLIDQPARAETVERLSLLGSAYKRKALISVPDRRNSLERMREYYGKASDRALAKNRRVDPYPLSNWLTAELTLAWQNRERRIPLTEVGAFKKGLSDCRLELESALKKGLDAWRKIGLCDLDLLEALCEERLDDEAHVRFLHGYREVRKMASLREFESVLDQFDFLEAMSGKDTEIAKKLHAIRRELDEGLGRKKTIPA